MIIASILTPSGSRATLFNFVSECRPNIPIAQGDARLTIANALDASCDLILVGAFLDATIPIHLLTKEAMAVYLRKLKPNGIVAMHVSYYHLELATVVAGIADADGAIMCLYGGDVQEDASKQKWIHPVAEEARGSGFRSACKLEILAGLHRLSGFISSGYRDLRAVMSTPGRWNLFGNCALPSRRAGGTNGRKCDIPLSLERGSVDRSWFGNEPLRVELRRERCGR